MTGSTSKDQIHQEMTDAMKAGDKTRVGALRMFVSAIRYREDELGHELDDDEIREVAGKEVKKRNESIEAFEGAGRAGGRATFYDATGAERDVIQPWAPAQLDDAAVDALVDEALAATGATSIRELGKVMGMVMGKAQGKVDGTLVQQKVRARLEG